MSQSSGENAEEKKQQDTEEQPTIFGDVVDLSMYEKSIKSTRNWLYMVAAIWLIWGIINFNRYGNLYDSQMAYFIFGEYLFVSLSFVAFAVWSYRKPAWAFLTAIIFYVVLNGWLYYSLAINMQSILLRIVIIISVVRGYFHARKYEELKQTMIFTEEEN